MKAQKRENFNNTQQVILFYAPWCSYSQNFLIIWKNIKKKKEFKNLDFVSVNIDQNPVKAKLFNVKYVPIVYTINGENKKKCPKENLKSLADFNNYLMSSFQ
tara:strand:+ start:2208 stop:2513 length:306 start_codon:yes stop_codon:yes gene_type:complete